MARTTKAEVTSFSRTTRPRDTGTATVFFVLAAGTNGPTPNRCSGSLRGDVRATGRASGVGAPSAEAASRADRRAAGASRLSGMSCVRFADASTDLGRTLSAGKAKHPISVTATTQRWQHRRNADAGLARGHRGGCAASRNRRCTCRQRAWSRVLRRTILHFRSLC